MREKSPGGGVGGGLHFPCVGSPLPNKLVSQNRCVNLSKTDNNDRTHESDANAIDLDIWSMLLSGQVPHSTNSSQLFWNGLLRKKKRNRGVEEGVEDILFFEKNPWNCFGFSLYPWKFQVKQNSTPGNLVKLCMLHSSEISRPKKNLKKLHP